MKIISYHLVLSFIFLSVSLALLACTPLVHIEVQSTQRTNSEATRNPSEINSPQLGSDGTEGTGDYATLNVGEK